MLMALTTRQRDKSLSFILSLEGSVESAHQLAVGTGKTELAPNPGLDTWKPSWFRRRIVAAYGVIVGWARGLLIGPGWGGGAVVVRDRKSRSHGEGVECDRSRWEQLLDLKLDQVLRGQKHAIIGPLAGVERHIRASQTYLQVQVEIDTQGWDKLAGAPQRIREIQSTAVEKLRGIAVDLERHERVGELDNHPPEIKRAVQLWVGAVARCVSALEDFRRA